LEYVYDPLVPPLLNKTLEDFAAELDIGEYEFTRTHWAIKGSTSFAYFFDMFNCDDRGPGCFRSLSQKL
jgi:hypothetical protein